eukprot:scaffold259709_cov14-Tisochrysis_lutea.AAC.1
MQAVNPPYINPAQPQMKHNQRWRSVQCTPWLARVPALWFSVAWLAPMFRTQVPSDDPEEKDSKDEAICPCGTLVTGSM